MDTTSKPKIAARDFFLHISVIIALYVFATSFLSFFFDIINYIFPDRQAYYADPYSGSMRFALSTLIVSFPLLLVLLRITYKDLLQNPVKRELALRKWLIYLTLFLTSIAVVTDLIVLLNTFLGGEISTRFIFKIVAVLVVAGGIFWTTLVDLRGTFFEKPKSRQITLGVASLIVITSVVWGFSVIGSPSSLRDLRDDNQRLSDVQGIQWQIVNYYQLKGTLPVVLTDLNDPLSGYTLPADPKTNLQYEYRRIVSTSTIPLTFELCATFVKSTQDLEGKGSYAGADKGGVAYPTANSLSSIDNWKHESGKACFVRTIDPLKYPVYDRKAI